MGTAASIVVAVIGAGPAGLGAVAALARRDGCDVLVFQEPASPASGPSRSVSRQRWTRRWSLAGDPTRPEYLSGVGVGGGALINAGLVGPSSLAPFPFATHTAAVGELSGRLLNASAGATTAEMLSSDVTELKAVVDAVQRVPHIDLVRERVERVLFRNRTVVGVVTESGRYDVDVVLVAAGALHTPILLADSGVDVEGLGEGLVDHPAVAVTVSPEGQHSGIVIDDGPRRTQSSRGASGLGGSARGDGRAPSPGVLIPFGSSSARGRDGLAAGRSRASAGRGMIYGFDQFGTQSVRRQDTSQVGDVCGVLVAMFDSARRGRVARSSVTGAPVVDLGDGEDWARMARVWNLARTILEGDGIEGDGCASFFRDATVDTFGTRLADLPWALGEVERWLRSSLGGLYHAAGSCSRVVDAEGNVHGYRGLVIADISRLAAVPDWPMLASYRLGARAGSGRFD